MQGKRRLSSLRDLNVEGVWVPGLKSGATRCRRFATFSGTGRKWHWSQMALVSSGIGASWHQFLKGLDGWCDRQQRFGL